MHNQRGALYVGNEYRLMSTFYFILFSSGSHVEYFFLREKWKTDVEIIPATGGLINRDNC